MTRRLGIATWLAIASLSGTAAGDVEDSKGAAAASFREGSSAFAAGSYAAAARAFEASHRFVPRAAAIHNAALSWDAAGDLPRAADDYWMALEKTDLRGDDADSARARLRDLERQLGTLDVLSSDDARISVAHVMRASAPLHVHLAPGLSNVTAEFPNAAPKVVAVDLAPGTVRAVTIERPRADAPVVPTEARAPLPETHPARTAAWLLAGGTVVTGGVAIFFGAKTLSAADTFSASGNHDRGAHDDAVSFRTITNVAWATTGVFAATAVVLFVVDALRARAAPSAGRSQPANAALHF